MAYVTVDVELDEFSDKEIEAEYKERGLGETVVEDDQAKLEKAYLLHHDGKRDQAYDILWGLCLERLNKVV